MTLPTKTTDSLWQFFRFSAYQLTLKKKRVMAYLAFASLILFMIVTSWVNFRGQIDSNGDIPFVYTLVLMNTMFATLFTWAVAVVEARKADDTKWLILCFFFWPLTGYYLLRK